MMQRKKLDFFTVELDEKMKINITKKKMAENVNIYEFKLSWDINNIENDDSFTIMWEVPLNDLLYQWSPLGGQEHTIGPDWAKIENSMLSSGAPIFIFYNGKSVNKYCWALNECKKHISRKANVIEQSGNLKNTIKMKVGQFNCDLETTLLLRIDETPIPIAETAYSVCKWWEVDCQMKPCSVPDLALEPVYSFWYSYHQDINEIVVEKECERAKKIGFNVCIVDDGWQTSGADGYDSCGDWEPAKNKFSNMAEHVKRVHDIGMKYILWFSIPYIGKNAKRMSEFKNMLLFVPDGKLVAPVLDPRYKQVRDFLLSVYKNALIEWNLDGFKLDFIDQWCEREENAPYNPKMDIPILQDAVDIFMIDIQRELREIKPDILIEFRQGYIGPNMRKYGNMFRVCDCPNDTISNRIGVLGMRMFLGNSAVHSDMLMWHKEEKPEIAALQIISVLFGVLQYSMKIDEIDDSTKKMTMFWLNFIQGHTKLLLSGKLSVFEPHLNYTWAKSTLDNECIVVPYAVDKCVIPDETEYIYIANGTENERVITEIYGMYKTVVYNCMGECVANANLNFNGITSIDVPIGGLIIMKKEDFSR